MRRPRWDDTRQDLRRLVFKDGAATVARRIHAHRATVYRLISGDTRRPSGPLRAAVEEVVADATTPPDTVGEET